MKTHSIFPIVEAALQKRLGIKHLHRRVCVKDDPNIQRSDVLDIEVTYPDLPYHLYVAALKGLDVEMELRAYKSRPFSHHAKFINRHPDAAFCLEMRRYASQGIVRFVISPIPNPLPVEQMGPPKPEWIK